MSRSKEQQFWNAADEGDLSVVKNLAADTTLDINWRGDMGLTAFNDACYEGHVSVVQFLLTLTTVDSNKPNKNEATPFYIACYKGKEWCYCF